MTSSDIQITQDQFIQFGGTIFEQLVLAWGLEQYGIQVRTNVNAPQSLTKLSSRGNPQPYRSDDDSAGNGAVFSDRKITAFQSKWDFPFDYEDFRNTYLADPAYKGMMLYEAALNFITKKYREFLMKTTLYNGVRNGAGLGPADICDGWGTIIAAEIVAGNLAPVATGAITSVNAEDLFKEMVTSCSEQMQDEGGFVYCSLTNFKKYADAYAKNHGFSYKADATGQYSIDNTNFIVKPVPFLATSNRLIATLAGNLVMGTDIDQFAVHPTLLYNIIKTRLMMPVGVEIQDLEVMQINDQA